MMEKKQRHLGDGFYVNFDGYQIAIAVNHHENVVAYMDEMVRNNFIQYLADVFDVNITVQRKDNVLLQCKPTTSETE